MIKKLGFIVFSVLFSTGLFSQPLVEVPVYMSLEVADERYEEGDYVNAKNLYEEAYKETRELALAHRIAEVHLLLRDFKRAERWYERVVEKDEMNEFPNAIMTYGQILKVNDKYQEAIDAFNLFATVSENDSLIAITDNEVAGIQLAMKEEAPIELVIQNVGSRVNSSYSESGPSMNAEGDLYFSTIDEKKLITIDGKEGEYWSKIYQTKMDDKGKWERPKALPKKINRDGYHTSTASFSDDGQRMYFTRTLMELNTITESKIFVSEFSGKTWGAPYEVEGINGNYLARQPSVGQLYGKDVLFFSTDMKGGTGGFDLYYSEKSGDGFTLPTNLGPKINSAGDDITPFFKNNRLYFSTDGRPSLGGKDIYFSDWDGEAFGQAANMGAGYNTSFDDLYFSINNAGNRGFIVSNRPSKETRSVISKTCCDEIFEFVLRDIVIDLVAIIVGDGQPLPGASVTMFEIENNQPGDSKSKTSEETNEFQFLLDMDKGYKVLVKRDGYYPKEISFNTVGLVDDFTVKKTITLEKIPASKPDVEIITINEPIRLDKINFDFNDDKILPQAEPELGEVLNLMNQYPDMVIELSSHTDAQGFDDYNQRLSQRRAQSTKNWLTERGISTDRIQAVGYGETQILNHCVDNMDCSDDEHRVNRRSEFKIIAGPTSIEVTKELFQGDEKKK